MATTSYVAILRWTARITGLVLVVMVVVFAIGEGLPNVFRQPPAVQGEFLAMAMMLIGCLAGWKREAIGGAIVLAGFVVFCGIEIAATGSLPRGAFPLFAIPGVLLLLTAGLAQNT